MWDVILYNGEADVLECRLREIGDLVERCILIEGDRTFQGQPRYGWTDPLPERFALWANVLHRWWVHGLNSPDPWLNEHYARHQVARALDHYGCPPDAMVLHGDVDEIPNRAVPYLTVTEPHVLWLRTFAFCVDWEDTPTDGPVLAPRHQYDDAAALRAARRDTPMAALRDAGWHLTWIGTPAERTRKLGSFSHPEAREWLDPERVVATGEGWLRPLTAVDVDGTWPAWIAEGRAPEWWYRPR